MSKLKIPKSGVHADIIEIEDGRFLVSFSPKGMELLKAAASYSLAETPPEDLPLESLRFIIDENMEWALWEFHRENGAP